MPNPLRFARHVVPETKKLALDLADALGFSSKAGQRKRMYDRVAAMRKGRSRIPSVVFRVNDQGVPRQKTIIPLAEQSGLAGQVMKQRLRESDAALAPIDVLDGIPRIERPFENTVLDLPFRDMEKAVKQGFHPDDYKSEYMLQQLSPEDREVIAPLVHEVNMTNRLLDNVMKAQRSGQGLLGQFGQIPLGEGLVGIGAPARYSFPGSRGLAAAGPNKKVTDTLRHETLHGLLSSMTPEESRVMSTPFRAVRAIRDHIINHPNEEFLKRHGGKVGLLEEFLAFPTGSKSVRKGLSPFEKKSLLDERVLSQYLMDAGDDAPVSTAHMLVGRPVDKAVAAGALGGTAATAAFAKYMKDRADAQRLQGR